MQQSHTALYRPSDLERFVIETARPGRYLGGELNARTSGARDAGQPGARGTASAIRIALVYPDTYEIGQSGLGLKILYGLINERTSAVAERAFAVDVDMERAIRDRGVPLFSLESRTPLGELDVVGFSLQYELTYTNILTILDLSRIPIFASKRSEGDPLVCGGGPCTVNPEPLVDFFDFFVLGEGEDVVPEMIDLLQDLKDRGATRTEKLRALAEVQGIYVPSMYEVSYDRDGRLRSVTPLEGARDRITRRIVSDLDSAYFPIRPVVPYIETVFDRVMLEIFRGCTRGCRFCQAGMIYRPVRERNPETLLRLAKESLDATGYEEISLASLSCSDYGRLGEFLRALQRDHSHHYLEVSLPSLRIDAFSVDLACLVAKNRKTTLTFAPEAGTQRLRDFINKGVTEEDLMSTLAAAKKAGWSGIKLYFMFGLPGERPEDLEGIKALARRVVRELKLKLNISLSAFVPKPMTVFQWEAQDIVEKLHEKTGMFRRMGHPHINASFSTPPMSFLEGVLARGDRRMGAVIHRAWLAGARFDGWREHFNPALWLDAFALENIDPAQYVHRERPRDEIFPWDHLMEPGTREFLWRDLERARKGKLTADCRGGACEGCGICVSGGPAVVMTKGGGALEPAADFTRFEAPAVSRVRVSFSKGPQVRFISHLDLMRAVERAIRRAKIPMAYSGGFHPRMRISFGYPLPLGYCSLSEWMDMDTAEPLAAEDLMAALNATLPPGIVLTGARLIPLSEPSLMAAIEQMEYRVYLENDPVEFPGIAAIVEEVTLRDYLPVEKKGKRIDLKNFIEDLKVQSGEPLVVEMRLLAGQGGSVTPREVLRLFEGLEPGLRVLYTERLACRKKESGGWVEP